MFNRNQATYSLGVAGVSYGGISYDADAAGELIRTAESSTIHANSIWYELFPAAIDQGDLVQIGGKLFYQGIMVSDAVSIATGLAGALILAFRFMSDRIYNYQRRKLLKIEESILKDE